MKADFFEQNRKKLGAETKGGLIVVTAFSKMQRTVDDSYKFEQESNFWYLTGIEEPDWWMIFDSTRGKGWLVRPDIDPRLVTFNGQLSDDEAKTISGLDQVISRDDALSLFRQLKRSHELVYTVTPAGDIKNSGFVANPAQAKMADLLDRNFQKVNDCRREVARMRAIKQPIEIIQIKKSIAITKKAFDQVRENLHSYTNESEIAADITYVFNKNKAEHGFDPIVATGRNACTLHYSKNTAKLQKNRLLLIDIGAKFGSYNADITRTYNIGKPSKRLVEVYDAVLAAQQNIIKVLRPTLSLQDLQHTVEMEMTKAIQKLELSGDDVLTKLPRYFPHSIGHGLGIDIHESLGYETLQEGMVLTIEPGLYISEESVGVRIEDDILITKTGHKNLSANISKDLVY
jgi:Xaa-Pro aminopeptidase